MSHAIVGLGPVGPALARAFARKNIEVAVASGRPPQAPALQARAIGSPGLSSSAVVAKALPGARLVKAFSHLAAGTLATDSNVRGGRRSCSSRTTTKVPQRWGRPSPNNSLSHPSISGSSKRVARLCTRGTSAGGL